MDWRRKYNKKRDNLYSSLYIVALVKALPLRQIPLLEETTICMIQDLTNYWHKKADQFNYYKVDLLIRKLFWI
jgi:hypothetical protein